MASKQSLPDLKSVAQTKDKAKQFVSSKETSKLIKQALLKEINSNLLSIKPQKIHQHERQSSRGAKSQIQGENPYRDQRTDRTYNPRTKGAKPLIERHGQVSSMVPSKIPRPLKPIEEREFQGAVKDRGQAIMLTSNALSRGKMPGYDWHKRGRINELKTRFLARKFLAIWMQKCFGRIPPQDARKFYERKLMKNAFCILEDAWWRTRKGWKLNIRAEYHNRYRLWKNSFRAWKLYTQNEREKGNIKLLAVEFNENMILKRCFEGLRWYFLRREEKKKLKERADRFRNLNSQRSVINEWKSQLQLSENERALEMEALSFWAINLRSKMFSKWKLRKAQLDVENRKMAVAIKHSEMSVLQLCLARFVSYVVYRRKKRYVKAFAIRRYCENLKQRTIDFWYLQLQRRLEIIELHDRIEFMSRKFILRSYFMRWQFYIDCTHDMRHKSSHALIHHHHKLKARCFKALQFHAKQRNLKNERLDVALLFRQRVLISRPWSRWLMRCEHSEELKMYPLTKIGRSFHRKHLLQKCLKNWCRYIVWRRSRKKTYAVADHHFQQRALPKYFRRLYLYKEFRVTKNEQKFAADSFNRELLQAKCFYTWLKSSRVNQEFRLQEMMAVLHHEEISKRRILERWRVATRSMLHQKGGEILADAHLEMAFKKKYFKLLKLHAQEESKRRKQEAVAVSHDVSKKLKLSLFNWKKYTALKRLKRKRFNLAASHQNRILMSKAMHAMQVYLQQRRGINKEVSKRVDFHNHLSLSRAFERWHESAVDAKNDRRKNQMAESFSSLKRLAAVFDAWRSFTALSKHRRSEENHRLDEVTTVLNQGKMKRALVALAEHKNARKRKRSLIESAIAFNSNNVKRKIFSAWKEYQNLAFRKLLLKRQSEIFHVKVKQYQYFQRWKMQHKISVQERNRSNVLIWWWSQNLQRKMIHAWKDFVKLNKAKKSKIAKALELRREFLLEDCLRKWLQYSTDMIAFRAKIAQSRQIEGTVKLQERVRRYALIWYRKSKERKPKDEKRAKESNSSHRMPGNRLPRESATAFEKKSVLQTIPSVNKEQRLQPRKPDYLRDSFDLTSLVEASANGEARQPETSKDDESRPRDDLPEPTEQSRLQRHPLNRVADERSIDFGVSSEDDLPKSIDQDAPDYKQLRRGMNVREVILLPPSSFKTANKAKQTEVAIAGSKEDHIFSLDDEDSEDECLSYSSESEDEEAKGNASPIDNRQVMEEIRKIKIELETYQKQQKHFKELEKRNFHISSWLSAERKNRSEFELETDEDCQKAMELQRQIQSEMNLISKELTSRKPLVTKLAKNVQSLMHFVTD